MNIEKYLDEFKGAADRLDKNTLGEKQVDVATGVVLNSVYLKLYKKFWANPSPDPLVSSSRIFFSVWMNDSTIKHQRISYNIHALKLRHLQGYRIESRKFANIF